MCPMIHCCLNHPGRMRKDCGSMRPSIMVLCSKGVVCIRSSVSSVCPQSSCVLCVCGVMCIHSVLCMFDQFCMFCTFNLVRSLVVTVSVTRSFM